MCPNKYCTPTWTNTTALLKFTVATGPHVSTVLMPVITELREPNSRQSKTIDGI